jgi:hypothetical protein
MNAAHQDALEENRARGFAPSESLVVAHSDAYLTAAHLGIGKIRGRRGRMWRGEDGTLQNTAAFALTFRALFFPEHPLVQETDGEGAFEFPRTTIYYIHSRLRSFGYRAVAEHSRIERTFPRTHARPRPVTVATEASL